MPDGWRDPAQPKPVEAVAGQGQQVGKLADGGKRGLTEHFHRNQALVGLEVEFHRLRRARQIGHTQHDFIGVGSDVAENFGVAGPQDLQSAAPERLTRPAHRDHSLHPVQKRGWLALLRFHVHCFVAVNWVHNRWQVEPLWVGPGKAGVAVRAPLHWGPHAVAIAEIDVVAHPDLVAVIDDGRAGHGQQQAVHQLDLAGIVVQQRRQSAADADVHAHARIGGVGAVHVVPLLVGDHFQGQLVVVTQENRPLAIVRDIRGLFEDFDDGIAVFLGDGHEHARHQRKMISHVAFIAVTEVVAHVFRPLVGLGQKQAATIMLVHHCPHLLDDRVSLGQIFVVGAFAHA